MPWLIKSTPSKEVPLSRRLFFVHVPRCGGTSLMQHFDVPQKVIDDRGLLGALAMKYFFMRYGQLEKANFPIQTRENGFCLILLAISAMLRYYCHCYYSSSSWLTWLPNVLVMVAVCISFFTTVICTAPVIGRITPVHRWYLWFVHYPCFRLCEAIDWCTGTNKHGYIMHLTATKLLGYGYVKPREMDEMCSLAIVRNPYSRMVSIYSYNKFGSYESFPAFLRRWHDLMQPYLQHGEKEEWYTPCHLLPQYEYTHAFNGKQLVQSVVKQEELKLLKTREGRMLAEKEDRTVGNLPEVVRDALLGMPHTNSRPTSKKWWDFYDQETMDLTHKMYGRDFEVFQYDTAIAQRPDLLPPKKNRRTMMLTSLKFNQFSRDSFVDQSTGRRVSQSELFGSVQSSIRKDMKNRRASVTSLKNSLVELNRDEILAQVAGIRTISTVRETFRESSLESDVVTMSDDASSSHSSRKED